MNKEYARRVQTCPRLNLGCGRFPDPNWINVDVVPLPGVDLVLDLNTLGEENLPLPDDCIEAFRMSHVIEHIQNILPMMQELHRVAKPGAVLSVRCPHGASDDAWEDPSHVRPIYPQSFGYFSQPYYWRADYGYRGDWLTHEIRLLVSANACLGLYDTELFRRISRERNWILEMLVTLVAIKPIRECRKHLQAPPKIVLERV